MRISAAEFLLGPMEPWNFARVIEGPAELAGLKIEPGLADRMVADSRTGDALPLLGFTLRELWERYGKDGDLTLTEYEHLGGLERSVQVAAEGVLAARPLSADEKEALRRALLQMCRINEEGQHARATARWEAMPIGSHEILRRFVRARLLVSGNENGTIEVAHEALLRTWPLLRGWLEESTDFLKWRKRLEGALAEYSHSGTLLRGMPLVEASNWLPYLQDGTEERGLVLFSLAKRKKERRMLIFLGILLAVPAIAAFNAFFPLLWTTPPPPPHETQLEFLDQDSGEDGL